MDELSLYLAALKIPAGDARERWLQDACPSNDALRNRLVSLLADHEASRVADVTEAETTGTGATNHGVQSLPTRSTADQLTTFVRSLLLPSQRTDSLGRLGPYEVLSVIGHGGMGIVLKARDTKLNRDAAVKLLLPHLAADPEARRRFLREAQAAAAVDTTNVVKIYGVSDEDPPYLAMELVLGESLQQRLDREGALGVMETLEIASSIAAGLSCAHFENLVHRDIKPANILIERGSNQVKVTDFGLARAVDDIGLTGSGLLVGTPVYMSPEQAQGLPVDHHSDLFSLGCVIYAMATGKSPFHANSTLGVIRRVCDEAHRPLREVRKDVPVEVSELVDKILAKRPENRLSAAEVCGLLFDQKCKLDGTEVYIKVPGHLRTTLQTPKGIVREWAGAVVLVVLGVAVSIAFVAIMYRAFSVMLFD